MGPGDPRTAMWIRDAARTEKGLPTIRQLESARYFPYRYGQALRAYLAGRYGDQHLRPDAARDRAAHQRRGDRAEGGAAHRRGHAVEGLARGDPGRLPAASSTGKKDPDRLRRRPRHREAAGRAAQRRPRPEPRRQAALAFLSERDLFSIELFVADTHTGNGHAAARHSTAVDPHLESLQFIESSGRVGPGGKALRARRGGEGPAGAGDHGRRRAASDAGDPVPDAGRDLHAQLLARRPRRRLLGARRRLHRPLHLRPAGRRRCGGSRTTPSRTCSRRGRPTGSASPS